MYALEIHNGKVWILGTRRFTERFKAMVALFRLAERGILARVVPMPRKD